MFVPDLLHEFELGVWKNTFKHLIQILYAVGDDLIQELNSQLAQSRFSSNASAMKKLAVRDFEDLLQVFFFFGIMNCVIISS